MVRLTQRMVAAVPSILAPSLTTIGDKEVYYLFRHEGDYKSNDDGLDIKLKANFSIGTKELLLSSDQATFDEHAQYEVIDKASKDGVVIVLANLCAKIPSDLDSFLSTTSGGKSSGNGKPTLQKGLQGRAAGEYELVREEEQEKETIAVDLTDKLVITPLKRGKSVIIDDGEVTNMQSETLEGDEEDFEEDESAPGHLSHSFVLSAVSKNILCGFVYVAFVIMLFLISDV